MQVTLVLVISLRWTFVYSSPVNNENFSPLFIECFVDFRIRICLVDGNLNALILKGIILEANLLIGFNLGAIMAAFLPDNFDWGRVIGRNHVLRITFLLFLVAIFQDTSITLIRVFSVWRVMQSSYLNKLASWFLLWRFKALLQLSCVCFTDQVLLILV